MDIARITTDLVEIASWIRTERHYRARLRYRGGLVETFLLTTAEYEAVKRRLALAVDRQLYITDRVK